MQPLAMAGQQDLNDVGCESEDPENALQMGFRGQKSALNFAGGVGFKIIDQII